MLGHVSERFARHASVAGYDIMNEPNAFSADQVAALGDFSTDALAAIRAGERSRHGFAHLVFFEPGILWSDFSLGTPPNFDHDDNVVFAPHIYRGGITSGPIQRADFERAAQRRIDVRRGTRAHRRVGKLACTRDRSRGRLLPGAPSSPGRVPLRRDAVDLAGILRRSPQGTRSPSRQRAVRVG